MSEEMINNIRELSDSINRNTPIVEERLRKAGMKVNPALVFSMAKYWDVLEKLAAE